MVVLIIIGAIALLAVWYLIANEFYQAAVAKGYPEKKYLWITFLLGAIGALLIIALPDRGKKETDNYSSIISSVGNNTRSSVGDIEFTTGSVKPIKPDSPRIASVNEWKCPNCGKINNINIPICNCGQMKP